MLLSCKFEASQPEEKLSRIKKDIGEIKIQRIFNLDRKQFVSGKIKRKRHD